MKSSTFTFSAVSKRRITVRHRAYAEGRIDWRNFVLGLSDLPEFTGKSVADMTTALRSAISTGLVDKKKLLPHDDVTCPDALRESQERETNARLNRAALLRVMQEFSFTIPTKDFDLWRPTVRTLGQISGLDIQLQILCTDGNLAYYNNGSATPFLGHIQFYDGEVLPLHSTAAEKREFAAASKQKKETKAKVKAKKQKADKVAAAVDLLNSYLADLGLPPA